MSSNKGSLLSKMSGLWKNMTKSHSDSSGEEGSGSEGSSPAPGRATKLKQPRFVMRRTPRADADEETPDGEGAKGPLAGPPGDADSIASAPDVSPMLNVNEDEMDRVADFDACLSAESVDVDRLRSLAWHGCPQKYRSSVWRILFGYLPPIGSRQASALERKRAEYQQYLPQYPMDEIEGDDEKAILHQISVDMIRIAPSIPLFHHPRIQESMTRLLYIWALRHPATRYVQGMDDLTTPFYIVFVAEIVGDIQMACCYDVDSLTEEELGRIEADSYWCLSKLIDRIPDHYMNDQSGIQSCLLSMEEYLGRIETLKPLHEHLTSNHIDLMLFAFRWFNCYLLRELPIASIIRFWDTYLSEKDGFEQYHVFLCMAFLNWWSESIMEMDFQQALLFLQNPPQKWTRKDEDFLLSQA